MSKFLAWVMVDNHEQNRSQYVVYWKDTLFLILNLPQQIV